jgi:two-component system response regulator HydG
MDTCQNILVVDDEEQILFILSSALSRLGDRCKVMTFSSGQQALEQARTTPFDLMLTDLRMPDMDGAALTEAVQAIYPQIVIIWMTAYGCPATRSQAERLGVYRCLDKPLEIAEIRQIVREALTRAKSKSVR